MRSEQEILHDLEKLCQSPGYVHAVASLCFIHNIISYTGEFKPKNLDKLNSAERLIRTEMSTIIGLMLKANIDFAPTPSNIIEKYINDTIDLLSQLHTSMGSGFFDLIQKEGFNPETDNPFTSASLLREAIFYSAESAYTFQYLDFSKDKYKQDNEWLLKNKGFVIEDAILIAKAICEFLTKKLFSHLASLRGQNPNNWTLLPGFTFTISDIKSELSYSEETIHNVLAAFSIKETPCNENFKEIGDFNKINACPIIQISEKEYLLLQHRSLIESIYESPFYWMYADKEYKPVAQENRGYFAENFATKRLKEVFGEKNVLQNIIIKDNKGKEVGEIDVLVIYSDRAIILQAKSKRLTVDAQKGNDLALNKDFQSGIQKAYEQGWDCANYILDIDKYTLVDKAGTQVNVRRNFREIFLFCVLSDHYPALAFQAHQFLKAKEHQVIRPPYAMDIFFLDIMAEFLSNPLYFLSFAHKRSEYYDKVLSSHEITVLSYHLRRNLWLDEYSMFHLGDDISQELDSAFIVRRLSIPGNDTPEGILTKFINTPFGKIIESINTIEENGVLDLGFYLLELDEKTVNEINYGIKEITKLSKEDKRCHDFSIAAGDAGLTMHCNYYPSDVMLKRLDKHCTDRKYLTKTSKWFGLAKYTDSENPFQVLVTLGYPWKQSDSMDKALEPFRQISKLKEARTLRNFPKNNKKQGRNDPCNCGSGIKYKKCCL